MPPRAAPTQAAAVSEADMGRRVEIVETALDGISKRLDDLNGNSNGQNATMRDIAASVKEISERLRKMENDSIGVMTALQQQMTAAFRRIDETKADLTQAKADRQKDIDGIKADVNAVKCEIPEDLRGRLAKIENVIPGLVLANKIMVSLATVIAVSLMGLLWAIFTGQATIIFGGK